MTAAAPDQPAIRINPYLHWFLSAFAAGVAVLVSSPLLPEWWRLAVGVIDAILVLLVARSQPKDTPAQAAARTVAEDSACADRQASRTAGRSPSPPMARRPPRRIRHGYLSGWVLLVVLLLCSGCLSLWHAPDPSSVSTVEACPVGKVCEDEPSGPPREQCESISAWHSGFVIAAGIFGGVATAGAAVVPFLDGHPDAMAGVGATAAGSGALGITFGTLAAWKADQFTRLGCGAAP
jgi:hypothetical protein